MSKSDAPRTDDQSVRYYDDATGRRIEYVTARFARQLERELTAARAEIERLKSQLTKDQGCVTISRNGYVQELEQQRDRLAEALEQIKIHELAYNREHGAVATIADEALQSLTAQNDEQ